MKIQDEILTELKTLRAGLGVDLNDKTVYQVPEGYFQNFPDEMASVIKAMNTETTFTLPAEPDNLYTVPDNYFDQLPATMLEKIKAFDRIAENGMPVLEALKKTNVYTLPENYFARFEETLFQQLFSTEENALAETESLSPLLASLKKEQPFSVPAGYFNAESLVQKSRMPEQKVVEHPAIKSIKWARWAAAAAVAIIFALSGWQYLGSGTVQKQEPGFDQALAHIPDAKIKEWLSYNMDEEDLNSIKISGAGVQAISTNVSLQNFSEEQIEDYLASEVW